VVTLRLVIAFTLGLGACSGSEPRRTDDAPSDTLRRPPVPSLREAAAAVPRPTRASACEPRTRIVLNAPGATPAEIEATGVLPIERVIAAVLGLTHVTTTIVPGRATMVVDTAASGGGVTHEHIATALTALGTLPAAFDPLEIKRTQPATAAQVVFVRGPRDAVAVSSEAMVDAAQRSAGVRSVRQLGRPEDRWVITVEEAHLRSFGLSVDALAAAVQADAAFAVGRAPSVGSRPTRARRQDLGASLGEIVVHVSHGAPIYLHDVATVAHERDPKGAAGWTQGGAAQVLLVETDDPAALRSALDPARLPAEVSVEIEGQIQSGCPTTLGTEFDLFRFDGPNDTETAMAWAEGAPVSGGVWLWGDSVLDGTRSPVLELLVPADAPEGPELLRWLSETPALTRVEHVGPTWASLTIELQHPDLLLMHNAVTSLSKEARTRGMALKPAYGMEPTIEIKVDGPLATRAGMTLQEVARQVRFARWGTKILLPSGRDNVEVWIEPGGGLAGAGERLDDLVLSTSGGKVVLLRDVASQELGTHPSVITRRDGARVLDLVVSVPRKDLKTAEAVFDDVLLPALVQQHPGLGATRR